MRRQQKRPIRKLTSFHIRRIFDGHVHARQDAMQVLILPFTLAVAQGYVVMPNTNPPILAGIEVIERREELRRNTPDVVDTKPIMTVQIIPQTTPRTILEAWNAGARAGKIYPKDMTTGSHNGVFDYFALAAVYAEMEELGMKLCLHPELPGADPIRSEEMFHAVIDWIATTFPKLTIIIEHITKASTLRFLDKYPNVWCTITGHHLVLTISDVIGRLLEPHHFCKPVAKFAEDLRALRHAAINHPKAMLGSDSAPHEESKKVCSGGCAGVFTAPVLVPLIAEVFDDEGATVEQMQDFTSTRAGKCWGLRLGEETITIEREPMRVPRRIGNVVPFRAGTEMRFTVRPAV